MIRAPVYSNNEFIIIQHRNIFVEGNVLQGPVDLTLTIFRT